ncbi:hypothetical protein MTsPCn9_25170 [Croceitalea sp. MTPC9]|uniref:hypothetical protein n=1 Tax=unclassified Croceitalea TaxID=2632280 RepID=UPI002B3A3AED|nr:hypothetical protein MTsPCn6_29360 [Croceitalea sp. MTPC6]GMN17579.1 hypothetical protein MTsPCn9_25170 [Croceitalea sp. MTPC9]
MDKKFSFRNSLEILREAQNHGLFDKLHAQLQKDFELANVDLLPLKSVSFESLETQLQEKVYVLLLEKFPDYLNLLYVIDIPEKEFREIKSSDVVEISKEVSFLILKRLFQKVWLKAKYV